MFKIKEGANLMSKFDGLIVAYRDEPLCYFLALLILDCWDHCYHLL